MLPGSHLHHRNYRKRVYAQGAEYFITSVTRQRKAYFTEPTFADLFVLDLWLTEESKDPELFGSTVLPDHIHLLFQPIGKANYSQIMGTVKRNGSRDIDDLIQGNPFLRDAGRLAVEDSRNLVGDDSNRRLLENYERTKKAHPSLPFEIYRGHFNQLKALRCRYVKRDAQNFNAPRFRWQTTFHEHLIRDQRDFDNHVEYIYTNAVRHGVVVDPKDWRWTWVAGMTLPFHTD